MGKQKVLVVDDEPFNYELIKPVLGEEFQIDYAGSGDDCIQFLTAHIPDIILLDVEMPGMNGYETCQLIKNSELTRNIPVTFVSARDSVEERLKGYEVGGDDYVIKPYSAAELRSKIEVAIYKNQEKEQLKQNATEAMGTAMTAMTSAGELGVVLHFFEASFSCKNIIDLADLVLDSMSSFGLSCIVYISTKNGEVTKCSNGKPPSTLELELMQMVRSKDRIFDFDLRTVINYPNISLLIKNMPGEDRDKYGRIKDNMAILVEGAESRIRAIEVEERLGWQQNAIIDLVDKTQKTLEIISYEQQQNKEQSVSNMDQMMSSLEDSFMTLGLTEEQEQSLLSVTQTAADKALELYEAGLKMDKQFQMVMDELKRVISK
ncbi:MAG: response regulator [Gammaproteobacteria bacterium]|nr:response regulator [Gammaproteobacteria bacterium]MDH5801721.1 response regulator [Gammaproteobacteria bacterium]